ncbi:MAG: translation elongation factor Ts [Acidobacteriota bacterium]|nr:translation elongation factor Ts [Acidobacteriota bacterium]MDQ7088498.1 translation elongation factor Ts [Acidobacteriota bacterium]
MSVTAQDVKKLRSMTGAGMMDCKKALTETGGDFDAAVDFLRKKGLSSAAKKAGRETSEGMVYAYIHPGSRVGVLIEVNCETDFVARTDDFQALVRDLAMHVAAAQPRWVAREDVSEAEIEHEKKIYLEQMKESGKPEAVLEKIVTGKMEKFYSENCLLEQGFIKDPDKTVKDLLTEAIAKLGENMQIARFVRYELGK